MRSGSFVSRQLFENEAIVRFVLIESANHIVAVAPGIGTDEVVLIAVTVGKTCHVQPMPCPALAVAFGVEQAIDQLFVGIRRRILFESLLPLLGEAAFRSDRDRRGGSACDAKPAAPG